MRASRPPHTPLGHESDASRLLRCVQAFAYAVRPLLLREHDLEAAKVVELPPRLDGSALLCEGRLVPLLDDVLCLELLLEGTRAGGTGKLGQAGGGEGEVAVGERLTGDTSCGTIDDSLNVTYFASQLFEKFWVQHENALGCGR